MEGIMLFLQNLTPAWSGLIVSVFVVILSFIGMITYFPRVQWGMFCFLAGLLGCIFFTFQIITTKMEVDYTAYKTETEHSFEVTTTIFGEILFQDETVTVWIGWQDGVHNDFLVFMVKNSDPKTMPISLYKKIPHLNYGDIDLRPYAALVLKVVNVTQHQITYGVKRTE